MPPKKPNTPSGLSAKDLVLAKMPRYPQWPAFIMPEDLIPAGVLKAKKKSTNFCVIFIPDGDFYWMTEKSLEPLTSAKLESHLDKVPEQFKKNPKKKKNGKPSNVNEAFVATDGLDFDSFISNIFNDDDEDEDDEEEDGEENEGEEDTSIKEEDNGEEEEDEEEEEEDEEDQDNGNEVDGASQSKHRIRARKTSTSSSTSRNGKRAAKSEGEEQSVKRSKLQITRDKKGAKNGNGTATTTPPETGARQKAKHESKPLTEEEKQHQLWLCRIKLQRSLIQRNQPVTPKDTSGLKPPTADELSVARLILYRLGDFPVSVDLLKKTKIHKVLKCILKDEALEYPDSFKLHERCQELLSKWDSIVQSLKLEKAQSSPESAKGGSESKLSSGHATQEESEISALNNSIVEKKETENEVTDPVPLKADIASV